MWTKATHVGLINQGPLASINRTPLVLTTCSQGQGVNKPPSVCQMTLTKVFISERVEAFHDKALSTIFQIAIRVGIRTSEQICAGSQ